MEVQCLLQVGVRFVEATQPVAGIGEMAVGPGLRCGIGQPLRGGDRGTRGGELVGRVATPVGVPAAGVFGDEVRAGQFGQQPPELGYRQTAEAGGGGGGQVWSGVQRQ